MQIEAIAVICPACWCGRARPLPRWVPRREVQTV